jgi:hypothetical protein
MPISSIGIGSPQPTTTESPAMSRAARSLFVFVNDFMITPEIERLRMMRMRKTLFELSESFAL